MKWNQIVKRLIPSFFKRKKEEEPMSKGMDHWLYEISISGKNRLDIDLIRKTILLNPWCLLTKPAVVFNENTENNSVTISFHILSQQKGKEIEEIILELIK